jgi:hypothetical protein
MHPDKFRPSRIHGIFFDHGQVVPFSSFLMQLSCLSQFSAAPGRVAAAALISELVDRFCRQGGEVRLNFRYRFSEP